MGGGGIGKLITVGAIIYTGGAAAGLWGAEAAAGAGLMEGAELASVAGEGFGADALFSQAAGYNGLAGAAGAAGAAGGWVTDPTTGLETWSGDAATTGLDTTISELGSGQWDLPDWASNSVDSMGFNNTISDAAKEAAQSFSATGDVSVGNPIGSLTNNSPISLSNQLNYPSVDAFGTDTTALTTPQGATEFSGGDSLTGDMATSTPKTNTLEGITSEGGNAGQGISSTGGNQGFQPQKYTYENKDFLTGKTGTGMTADVSELAPNFKQGLEMNNLPDLWKKANTPLWNSGSNVFKAPTPLGMAGRGLSALFDVGANRDAMKLYQDQMSRMQGAEDSNAARGGAANSMWTENFQSPTAGYDEFMRGAGRDLVNNMRATAAKSGNRGSYLGSGRFQSDLQSAYLKNQNARGSAISQGFSNQPYQASSSVTPGLAQMTRNKYAPIGQAIANVDRSFSLNDLFGND